MLLGSGIENAFRGTLPDGGGKALIFLLQPFGEMALHLQSKLFIIATLASQ